jgi:chemotaxis family two-component system sensor kinase Cph1
MADADPTRGASLEVHPETGTILAIDPVLETLLGFQPGELAGRHVSVLKRENGPDPFAELFSDATHDLLGPLNQASALVTLLVRKMNAEGADSDTASLLGFISSSVKRMETLTGALRLYSKQLGSPAVLRTTDLDSLWPAVVANFERQIADGELGIKCGALPVVACDASQILFLLTHLIENAWKFRQDGKATVEIESVCTNGECTISVRDNGIGFDPRFSSQVFRMFKRLEGDRFAGSGAGLTICKQIVTQHHGRIWAESEPGQGTTIRFTLRSAA